jgi:hypothetical protein
LLKIGLSAPPRDFAVHEARHDAVARGAGGQAVLGALSIDRDETLARFYCG